jgi:hypothetical protein
MLLDIIYQREKQNKQVKETQKSDKIEDVNQFALNSVLEQLDSTQSRYMVVGILISFIISFVLWMSFSMLFNKKIQIVDSPAQHTRKKKHQ